MGPLRHLGDLARARATRRSSRTRRPPALAELEARPLELPPGLEVEWLGVSGYRLSYEGQTLFVDPYLSRVPFRSLRLAAPGAAQRRPRSTASSTRPGETVGVLVGHTHFDHAVDAPAIARRTGCRAYGSDSLVNLMALHGLAERAVEVEPYRTYELGPFEVSFTPSVHSKLLLGLAVPYDGELSCEHLDALAPGRLPLRPGLGDLDRGRGAALLPPGQRQPGRRRGARARRRRLPRRRRRPQLHPRLLAADPAAAGTASGGPDPLRQLLPPARRGDGVRRQRPARRAAGGDRRGQPRLRGRGAAALRPPG